MPNKAVASNTVALYSILNLKYNIKVALPDQTIEAALVKFAFKPLAAHQFGQKRDYPDKMVKGTTWNYYQYMPFRNGHHNSYTNTNTPVPQYAVLVEDVDKLAGAKLLRWNGEFIVTQEELDALPVIGFLSGGVKDGVYTLGLNYAGLEAAVEKAAAEGNVIVVDSIGSAAAASIEEEFEVEDLPEIAPESYVSDAPYTGDPFTVDATGHYVGDDNFIVPRDYAEFEEWNPNYISNWVRRRLGRGAQEADVEDWTADLRIHIAYLPAKSKHRLLGKTDVIMTFDPIRQYGASERRFRSYINNCLANRFSTIQSKRKKNPICHTGNLSLGTVMDPDNYEVVDDEYLHQHSEYLTRQANQRMRQSDDMVYLSQLISFVREEEPSLLAVMEAMAGAGTQSEAARDLGMTEQEFSRARNRLKVIGACLKSGQPVPKQRKPYKKRGVAAGE